MKHKGKYRRGYPVAILAGVEEDRAVLWKVFSNVVKPEKTLWLDGTRDDSRALYCFHESIVNALRPTLKEGVRSIVLVSPVRTSYAQQFIDHIHSHHAWLVQGPNRATFSQATGSAGTLSEVASLVRTPAFKRLIRETTSGEAENLIDLLEKHLNSSDRGTVVLYSFAEIENLILAPQKTEKAVPEYLLLTDDYLSDFRNKNRMHRLMQVATNRNIKTRIVDKESNAGQRLTQLGGMIYFARFERERLV